MDWRAQVAVITGAASGIGRGLAEKAAQLGMKLVIADIDQGKLDEVEAALTSQGCEVLTAVTDVADPDSVARMSDQAFARYGKVNLLFNNAGVLVDGVSWERSIADWRWVLDVNVMGVIHGIKAFVPRMIEAGEPGWIVNTASMAGLIAGPYLGPYTASKHALVGITETMHYELLAIGSKIRTAVLCPGEVATEIFNSERIRPERYGHKDAVKRADESDFHDRIGAGVARGMPPIELASFVFEALAEGKFWIFPHSYLKDVYRLRADSILNETVPGSEMAP